MIRFHAFFLGLFFCVTIATSAAPILESKSHEAHSFPAYKSQPPNADREIHETAEVLSRALHTLVTLSRRAGHEFVGWHGTNSDTANLWTKAKKIVKPKKGKASSGAGQHLGTAATLPIICTTMLLTDRYSGPGLYVTDDWTTATVFANWNAHSTKKKAKVCAIYAKSSTNWRAMMTKVWMPNNLIGDNVPEAKRQTYIHSKVPHKMDASTIKFSPLDPKKPGPNQLVIPDVLTDHFEVHCVDVGAKPPAGIPTVHYSSEQHAWHIVH
ncbi:hypothetical protein DAEQUDRAFT_337028 [Daedalea quercina L-15889]|uniref:Uncharacterized protein n=1 Tax=Daedalea quercina L-15889 TaxID=1314783 RepID=A0A165PIL3_9APHY|nr:hypothetical protein DAEQUDRAFT_337028 [Daedalea quercina L-15889]